MASTLQLGSTGSQVTKLQKMLSQAGYYSGQATGTYDEGTRDAVAKYQQQYKLAGGGVFDNPTLQHLYGTLAKGGTQQAAPTPGQDQTKTQKPQTPAAPAQPTAGDRLAEYAKGYTPSDAVAAAQDQLAKTRAAQPGEYKSPYDDMIRGLFDQIMTRKPFQYDVNGDALYNMYKDQYTQGGRLAMQDTMGQAAQLTGGFGNTYAQQVGQQTYNKYMTDLAGKIPELEQQAYNRWADEGDRLRQDLAAAQGMDDAAYSRWADDYSRWRQGLEYDTDMAQRAEQQDYDRWATDRGYWTQAEQQEYARRQDEESAGKQSAYQMAMKMIQAGVMPSTETLTRAGIAEADAQGYVDMIKKQMAAAGSSGGGRGGSGGKPKKFTEEQLEKAMTLYSQGGDDGVFGYLGQLEYQGYDPEEMWTYLHTYGKAGKSDTTQETGLDKEKRKKLKQ